MQFALGGYRCGAGHDQPGQELTKMAKDAGALTYTDAVQYVPHGPLDVQDLDCDFLVCSSYKDSEPQIIGNIQFHGSPGHRKDKTVTFWNENPKGVMGYNQYSSPISLSECIQ